MAPVSARQTRDEAGRTRAGSGFDRVVMCVAAVGGLWLVLFATLAAASRGSPELARFVGSIVYMVPIAAAVGLSAYAAGRTRQRLRIAWRLMTLSNALWLAGEATWAVLVYRDPVNAPVPSAADIGYLLSYLVAIPAIAVGVGLGGSGRNLGLLDALLMSAGGAALGWRLAAGPAGAGGWSPEVLTVLLYSVLSVSVVSVLAAALLGSTQPVPASMVVLGCAFGVAALTDAAYVYLTMHDQYAMISWLSVGWQAEAVLLCVAAAVAARRREADEKPVLDADMSALPAVVAGMILAGVALADLINVGQLRPVTVVATLVVLLGLLVRQVTASRDRSRRTQRLRRAAMTDPLTGLHNRRFFEGMLDIEADAAARRRTPLSVLLLDLDHFKRVNDTHGHATGDIALAHVADLLRGQLHGSDVICRYGGEEFACLLPATSARAALAAGEQILSRLRQTVLSVPTGPPDLALTASIGVATAEPQGRSLDTGRLVESADQALYRAKALGRDRVVQAGHPAAADDTVPQLPAELVWLADHIDAASGDGGHAAEVSRCAARTAARLGLADEEQHRIAAAARVHAVGRLTIVADDRGEPCSAGPGERVQDAVLLDSVMAQRPDLKSLVEHCRENYDGSGQPGGLAGQDIPVGARIIAVCEAWAQLRAGTAHTGALSTAQAQSRLVAGRGRRYDPAVVDAFLAVHADGLVIDPARTPTTSP